MFFWGYMKFLGRKKSRKVEGWVSELGGCFRVGSFISAVGELGRGWRDIVGIIVFVIESSVLFEVVVFFLEISLIRF